MTLDIRQMRQVLALAEHGSFSRAAAALSVTQPTLSRSIQGVEQQVGRQLFVRTTTGVELTDGGRIVALRARQIVQMSDDLNDEITSDRALQSGHVWLGSGPHPAQSSLADALARFITAFPRVSTRMLIRDWDELLRGLRSREIEFFVAETSTLRQEGDIEIESLPTHPVYFAARSGHPLAAGREVRATDVLSYPLVTLSRIPPRLLEPLRAAHRKAAGAETPMSSLPTLECNAVSVLTQVVLSSDAVMAATLANLRTELESGRIVLLGSEPWLASNYGIVTLKSHRLSSASARFREFIVEAEQATLLDEKRLLALHKAGLRRRQKPPGRRLRGTERK